MRRIQSCSGISSETLLIYLVLISHGNEEALAFSAPHSLTKPIFLSSLLLLSAQLKITLRRATFFPSLAQSRANTRPPGESRLPWETLLPLSPTP